MHTFDRQTDRRKEFLSLDRVSIVCSAVKTTLADTHYDSNIVVVQVQRIEPLAM